MGRSSVYTKCPNCGKAAERRQGSDILFCAYCGARLTDSDRLINAVLKNEHEEEMRKLSHKQKLEEMQYEKNLQWQRPDIDVHEEIGKTKKSFTVSAAESVLGFFSALLRGFLKLAGWGLGIAAAVYLVIKFIGLLLKIR